MKGKRWTGALVLICILALAFSLRAAAYFLPALPEAAKPSFQDEAGEPYLTEMDSYFYARLAREMAEAGGYVPVKKAEAEEILEKTPLSGALERLFLEGTEEEREEDGEFTTAEAVLSHGEEAIVAVTHLSDGGEAPASGLVLIEEWGVACFLLTEEKDRSEMVFGRLISEEGTRFFSTVDCEALDLKLGRMAVDCHLVLGGKIYRADEMGFLTPAESVSAEEEKKILEAWEEAGYSEGAPEEFDGESLSGEDGTTG